MHYSKDCEVKFTEHIGDEVKRLYATFPHQPMTELTDVLKGEHETAENVTSVLKGFITLRQQTTTTTSVLMSLSRLAGVSNFLL